jgi:hypothetical protein
MSEEKVLTGREKSNANLRPSPGFTKDNAVEIGRRGGIASGVAKRRNKSMKEAAEAILNAQMVNPKTKKLLEEAGIDPEQMTNFMSICVGMLKKAEKGDTRAADFFVNAVQEDIKSRELEEKRRSNLESEKAKREELRLKEKAIELGQNINLNVDRSPKFDDILSQIAGSSSAGLKEDE